MLKINIFIFLILFTKVKLNSCDTSFDYKTILDHDNNVRLEWSLLENDDNEKLIRFKLILFKIRSSSFVFGFGMSDRGTFKNADLCLFEINSFKLTKYDDAYTNSSGILFKDSNEQNYLLVDYNHYQYEDRCEIIFQRKLNTCDDYEEDYLIETGTVHLIYFIYYQRKASLEKLYLGAFMPSVSADIAEMKQAQLIKSTYFQSSFNSFDSDKNRHFDVVNNKIKLPAEDTTYWCLTFKLDDIFKQKHHIIAFESVITPSSQGIVHHMELFHCVDDPATEAMKKYNGPCKSEEKPDGLKQCRKVIAAWAMGATRFIYPDNVGGILGGEDYSPYVVLEIHYDNPFLRNDIIDSSGIRIFYQGGSLEPLRKYDAGIMEIGLEYNPKNSIPPRTSLFHMHGSCLSECTRHGLDPNGITIFASQLHTHLTGRRVWTSLIRNNQVIEIINSDNHYDQMFQEIRLLKKPIRVRPGDVIINTCVYDTTNRINMTFGGYSIRDEMCVNYMHYYPLSKLEVCKSSISDQVLSNFFDTMKRYDYSSTSENKSVEENFQSIRWTPITKGILDKLYDQAPIAFSCNSSNGEHIQHVYDDDKKWFNNPVGNIENLSKMSAPLDTDFVGDEC